jgi:hypothetical protein
MTRSLVQSRKNADLRNARDHSMENPVLRETKFMWRLIGRSIGMIDLKSTAFG